MANDQIGNAVTTQKASPGPLAGKKPIGNQAGIPKAQNAGQRKPGGAQQAVKPIPTVITIAPPAQPAKIKGHHTLLFVLFLVMVVAPIGAWAYYLYERAADQFVSTVGFTVQTEELQSPIDILGGLGSLSGGGSQDADILYKFVQSQEMVQVIDSELALRTLFSKPENDPIFAYDPEGTIEDLVDYWQKMVRVNYDTGTGLIELQVRSFTAKDSQLIAQAIFTESSRVINALSAIAREDTTRYAREELDRSVERLKVAREAMTHFRLENQIADPETEIVVQTGLMNALQQRLSDALIELDLLSDIAPSTDPRIKIAQRKIAVIDARIGDERLKFGAVQSEGAKTTFSTMIGEYESLLVDREFAEKTYLAALQSYDFALAEAQRQSRYLAAYVSPTLAESAQYPRREMLIALVGIFLILIWTIMTLILYSIRDRR